MFDRNEKDMKKTLGEMAQLSRQRSNFDQGAAKEKFKEFLRQDRRFDGYNVDALVTRVDQCLSAGAQLDLTDPVLRGGERRPLDRSGW